MNAGCSAALIKGGWPTNIARIIMTTTARKKRVKRLGWLAWMSDLIFVGVLLALAWMLTSDALGLRPELVYQPW